MADHMKREGNIKIVVVAIAALSLILAVFWYREKTNQSTKQQVTDTTSQPTKTFESKVMRFSIETPVEFTIVNKEPVIELNSPKGRVLISRNGTNFDTIEKYLVDFDARRRLKISEENKIIIEGRDTISRMMTFPEEKTEQKSYFLLVDNAVYTFSTSTPSLYSTLDQIVQTFKYLP